MAANIDTKTVEGFGDEWSRFDQTGMTDAEHREQFERYFNIFPWSELPKDAVGFDLGCGSGRWAALAAKRVGKLYCIDASIDALVVAKKKLIDLANVEFHHASVDAIPLEDNSMDFGYSLGVLHHVPDTAAGIASCVGKLKRGAPFLVYLYYAFDNRPVWFRAIWKTSDMLRRRIASLPFGLRKRLTDSIAIGVYFPLARMAGVLEMAGLDVDAFPLSTYRNHSFYTMRTDALDRFGTQLEHRFTAKQITQMMRSAGLIDIRFRYGTPYWCAVGTKA
ncbi:MAG TPA: methyltransferase domain-containing protein, partial [Pyrinomonadaceae bacterium]|nr:methyltransferase domain-containing protein [Pyrinomonadaceae bacterium]